MDTSDDGLSLALLKACSLLLQPRSLPAPRSAATSHVRTRVPTREPLLALPAAASCKGLPSSLFHTSAVSPCSHPPGTRSFVLFTGTEGWPSARRPPLRRGTRVVLFWHSGCRPGNPVSELNWSQRGAFRESSYHFTPNFEINMVNMCRSQRLLSDGWHR